MQRHPRRNIFSAEQGDHVILARANIFEPPFLNLFMLPFWIHTLWLTFSIVGHLHQLLDRYRLLLAFDCKLFLDSTEVV